MKKKVILLAGLCLAIGLCFGGWWLLSRDGEEEAGDTLWQLQSITAITIADDAGGSIPLEKTVDGWVYSPDTAFPLEQGYPQTMENALLAPAVGRILTQGLDLTGWGLDTPWATVTFTGDGRTETLCFGDENPVTGQYYVTVAGREGMVYMMDGALGDPFDYTLTEMADLPDPLGSLDTTSIYDIQVESGSGTVHLWNDNSSGWVVQCEEQGVAQTPADASGPEEIVSDVGYLYYNTLVSWHALEELETWGMEAPDMTVQLKGWSIDSPDIAMTVRFRLKRMPDSDDWYIWEEGSDCICTVYNYMMNRLSPRAADYLPAV